MQAYSEKKSSLITASQAGLLRKENGNNSIQAISMHAQEPFSTLSFGVGRGETVNRKCSQCNEEEQLQRKENAVDSTSFAPPIVQDVLNSGGRSMDSETRSFMEPRFNYDFSNVKIHDNDLAAKSADSINALAYTSGNNVVFNSGQYDTNSDSGKRLLAHELTHVMQQENEGALNEIQMQSGGPYHPPEGTELNCTMNDPCSDISLKINYLEHTIMRHIEWDIANPNPAYPLGRHATEIADLNRALENCIAIAQTKCRNQPEVIYVPQPQEQEAKEREAKRIIVESSPLPIWVKYVLYGIIAVVALVALYAIVMAIIACFTTGVCEAAIVIGGLGGSAAAAVLFIFNRLKGQEGSQEPSTA